MKPHPKSLTQLLELAELFHREILTSLPNAVPFEELYELKMFKSSVSVNRNVTTIEKATKRLGYFEKLKKSCIPSFQKQMPLENKVLQGMYIFSVDGKAVYLGISRNVFNRLKQHVYGKTHFSASLAYRIHKEKKNYDKSRSGLDFSESQLHMRTDFSVNVIPVENDYELYWLEVTLAGMLGTLYNEFRTH